MTNMRFTYFLRKLAAMIAAGNKSLIVRFLIARVPNSKVLNEKLR